MLLCYESGQVRTPWPNESRQRVGRRDDKTWLAIEVAVEIVLLVRGYRCGIAHRVRRNS